MSEKINVMIIDDSFSIRMLLRGLISNAPDMRIIESAPNPVEALKKLKTITPDVITLDVEMPEMDGLTFLKKLMNLKPIPVVMISTTTAKGSSNAIEALEIGAVDVIGKPSANAKDLEAHAEEIISRVREAAHARVGNKKPRTSLPMAPTQTIDTPDYLPTDAVLAKSARAASADAPPLIAIGASTGGTEAIRTVLKDMPTDSPPVVITQHIAAGFTKSFAKRLNEHSPIKVQEAEDNMKIEPGNAYISPGDAHLTVERLGKNYICKLLDGQKVRRHKPSVDVLFRSVANNVGKNATAAILTGMGDDGAEGLKEIKDTGAFTIAQDEESCVVFGMPRVAIEKDAHQKVVSLSNIAKEIQKRTS